MNARSLKEMISIAIAPAQIAPPEGSGRWIDVCALEDIPRLGSRVVPRASGASIAVFRTATDTVFALDDRCPHKGGPLSQGIVFGDRVACPLHNWNIELGSGNAVAPDQGCTARHAVQLVDGRVLLDAAALG